MHEYSITERLFQLALGEAKLEEGERIQRLHIELDPDSGYAPDAIRFYFEHLAEGSEASGAELVFRVASPSQNVPSQQIRLLSLDIESHPSEMSNPNGALTAQKNNEPTHLSNPPAADRFARWAIAIDGVVQENESDQHELHQSVYNLAKQHNLSGWLANTALGMQMEIEGPIQELEHFCHHLQHEASAFARHIKLKIETAESKEDSTVDSRLFF